MRHNAPCPAHSILGKDQGFAGGQLTEEVRLAHQALLQAAKAGPITVRFVGLVDRRPVYRVLNTRDNARFSLEALRRAALLSDIRFTVDK
jgi:hypothetical protein